MSRRTHIHRVLLIVALSIGAVCSNTSAYGQQSKTAPSSQAGIVKTANHLLNEAEDLAAEWKAESFRKALKKYEEARVIFHSLGDRSREAVTIKRAGDMHYVFGSNNDALTHYFRALELVRDVDRVVEIQVLNAIARAYGDLGNAEQTLKYAELARQYSLETGDQKGKAEALTNVGLGFYSSSDIKQALSALAEALESWKVTDDPQGRGVTLLNMGYSYGDSGDLSKAFECYQQALTLARQAGDRRTEAQSLTALGGVNSWFGEEQQAFHYHNLAVQQFHTIGDRNGEAVAFNGLGYVFDSLGEKRKALSSYTRAMTLFKSVGNPFYEGLAMGYVANMLQALGENQKALVFYRHRLALSRAFRNKHVEAYTLKHIGTVIASRGDRQTALSYYNKALAMAREVADKRGQSVALNAIGSNYDALGKKALALKYHQEALALVREVQDRPLEVETLYQIARIQRDLGQLSMARSVVEELIRIVDAIRLKVANLKLRASYFASVHQAYELYVDILMGLHKSHPTQRFEVLAFEASEGARARTLLETLHEARVDIRSGVPAHLLQRERTLQQLLRGKSEVKTRLVGTNPERAEELEKDLTALTSELFDIQGKIKESSPRYGALMQPVALTLGEIQSQTLDDDTVLLEYMLGEQRSYLWAVSLNGISSYELPSRREIEAVADIVRRSLTGREPRQAEMAPQYLARVAQAEKIWSDASQRLSNMLFGPASTEIAGKRLLVVSEGALQYVPFVALPVPAPAGRLSGDRAHASLQVGQPMLLEHELVNIPSASTLALLRHEKHGRMPASRLVAVLADPVFDRHDPRVSSSQLSQSTISESPTLKALQRVFQSSPNGEITRLPSTRREAESIREIALPENALMAVDFDACRTTALSSELGQYTIIHFATHAVLNTEDPTLSGILLSLVDKEGHPQDGFVGLNDIYNMKLSADMVVLSACSTALGKQVKGEGLEGLARSFMYAGVPRVIASLWKVDDVATANLMKHFYRVMLKDNKAPAASLRAAQIEMYKQPQWRSPYYWAAFVVQGEYR
jgi:tetratricopeptide (TPR) repeat protein